MAAFLDKQTSKVGHEAKSASVHPVHSGGALAIVHASTGTEIILGFGHVAQPQ